MTDDKEERVLKMRIEEYEQLKAWGVPLLPWKAIPLAPKHTDEEFAAKVADYNDLDEQFHNLQARIKELEAKIPPTDDWNKFCDWLFPFWEQYYNDEKELK